jgi:predicted transcriptional regulator|tara:strand:+ start:653 stop:814 length:162 start_codon:yes stop_codon:yes gene_type:complete
MQLNQNKVPRITRSYRVKPELDRRFTQATEKDARVKSRIIEQAVERYCLSSGT